MPGPCRSTPPRGLKAQLSAEMLEISAQTLRYWRKNLDPHPENGYFSTGRLLAYRVLKVLIRHHFIPVELLQRCDIAQLFEYCEHVSLSVLERSFIYIDAEHGQLRVTDRPPVIINEDLDCQVIALKRVIAAHRAAWEGLGRSPAQRRDVLQSPESRGRQVFGPQTPPFFGWNLKRTNSR